jgi:SAM-dependent methyltransferase
MSLGVRFTRWPRPISLRLLPALRYLNLMRALEFRVLAPWVRDVEGWAVLDVGCGHGLYTADLVRRGATLAGCDLHRPSLAAARETAGGLGLEDQVMFLVADAAELPLTAGHFDLVVCNCVLEHIQDDLGALEAMVRVLRPGGSLFLTVDHADHGLVLGLLEHLPKGLKSRLLQPEIAAAPSVEEGLDDYLDELYAVCRRYVQADLLATLSGLDLAVLYTYPYLLGIGGAHYELFHALRHLNPARGVGRLLYMVSSLLLYPWAVLSERRARSGGHGLAVVAHKTQAAGDLPRAAALPARQKNTPC